MMVYFLEVSSLVTLFTRSTCALIHEIKSRRVLKWHFGICLTITKIMSVNNNLASLSRSLFVQNTSQIARLIPSVIRRTHPIRLRDPPAKECPLDSSPLKICLSLERNRCIFRKFSRNSMASRNISSADMNKSWSSLWLLMNSLIFILGMSCSMLSRLSEPYNIFMGKTCLGLWWETPWSAAEILRIERARKVAERPANSHPSPCNFQCLSIHYNFKPVTINPVIVES